MQTVVNFPSSPEAERLDSAARWAVCTTGEADLSKVQTVKTIPLTQGKVALVDDKDFPFLSQWKWSYSKTDDGNEYARRSAKGEKGPLTVSMHRVIMSALPDEQIDHKDRNGLNNQRYNLRASTQSQNIANSHRSLRNSSGFKGVTFYKRGNSWQAQIMVNYRNHYLGRFTNPRIAAEVYDRAANGFFGEFALTNKSLGLL